MKLEAKEVWTQKQATGGSITGKTSLTLKKKIKTDKNTVYNTPVQNLNLKKNHLSIIALCMCRVFDLMYYQKQTR